jgi:pimeloyl-ACP methyl ester carboxylesterase
MRKNLVLVSGLLSNGALWKHQTAHLGGEISIQVISPSGKTPKEMVEAILDCAPPQFSLAGHSMGGWLCLEVMRVAPERVSSLCLLNTTARSDSEEKKSRRLKMVQRVEKGEWREVVRELVEHLVFNPVAKKEVEKMFLEVGPKAFIRQEKAMLARGESLSVLPMIKCPTLVMHAAQDRNFSLEEHRELAEGIQNSRLSVVEGSGHMSPIEAPEAITSLLRSFV